MAIQSSRDDARASVAFSPPTARQRNVARAFCIANACAALVIASTGLIPLPRIDGFIPAVQSIMATADLITAVLLFGQYATERARALLLLAGGYLLTALLIVAQTLTFPGAFTPTGLLAAGPQTAAWLYFLWHLALPTAALGYALLKPEPDSMADAGGDPASAIQRTVVGVVLAAAGMTGAIIVADDILPPLVISATAFAATASYITVLVLIVSVVAFLFVWRRRTSILDEWLLVALTAFVAEAPIIIVLGASRYTSSFYSSRLLALLASCAVLVALLSEMTRLYVRLSRAIAELQRERATKLMNLDVVVSSIGHEIRQPLTVTRMCTEVIEALLKKPRIEIDEVRENLDDISGSTVRIAETIDSLRGLFRNPHEDAQRFDVNDVVSDALRTLKTELDERGIAVTQTLAADLPRVNGHRGQLREVFLNILQNAIDAMAPLSDRPRTLQVVTRRQRDGVSVTIADSGPGIEPARLPNIFTAFISTKPFGMGLGLSICRMIVDRHSGQLLVSSELGKGTVFEVRLPTEPDAADPSLADPANVEA